MKKQINNQNNYGMKQYKNLNIHNIKILTLYYKILRQKEKIYYKIILNHQVINLHFKTNHHTQEQYKMLY